ncbi:unnamed protein product [Dovyalis caffra]|uniref:Uncharacterized protein n=1 Tax=Dovyalis caffra TaxID=77055 RepID=A0AAV1RLA7_9ROSI|nr:unnamed protein product [Dovyalis caffra]
MKTSKFQRWLRYIGVSWGNQSFITTPIDVLRIVLTLLKMPSANNKGRTIPIASLASDTSSPLCHRSMARNAVIHIFFKCFSTWDGNRRGALVDNLVAKTQASKDDRGIQFAYDGKRRREIEDEDEFQLYLESLKPDEKK